jgi:hypothetical protein
MLETVREAWIKNPDLRLTQLLINVIDAPGAACPPVFYCEDDKLHAALQQRYLPGSD